jgi:hypothetical protein
MAAQSFLGEKLVFTGTEGWFGWVKTPTLFPQFTLKNTKNHTLL